ncbi:MAG TPA: hypothetical protein VMF65_24935, partial [Acidimicrobiales bacterium]|nr:hypothetical protein [Acidimicrobiales bacterium]
MWLAVLSTFGVVAPFNAARWSAIFPPIVMTTGNELVAQRGTRDVLARFPPQIANGGYLSIAHFGNGYLLLTTTGIFTVSGKDGKSHLVANLASTPAGVFST